MHRWLNDDLISTVARKIRKHVVVKILEHAKSEAPHECCGLLVGTPRLIEQAVPARNLRSSATRYLVDPVDHFAAIRYARRAGLKVVGAYHSHPVGLPIPSPTDVNEATYPEYLYLIAAPNSDENVAAYRLGKEGLDPIKLEVVS
jgi:proteasome lid subunit RPN8/RPN11